MGWRTEDFSKRLGLLGQEGGDREECFQEEPDDYYSWSKSSGHKAFCNSASRLLHAVFVDSCLILDLFPLLQQLSVHNDEHVLSIMSALPFLLKGSMWHNTGYNKISTAFRYLKAVSNGKLWLLKVYTLQGEFLPFAPTKGRFAHYVP